MSPNTSTFNVEFCLYGTYVGPYVSLYGTYVGLHILPVWPAKLVTPIVCHYCHHMRLFSCPTPSPSLSKYVKR